MKQLEDSVTRLESGDLTLEESLAVFERGVTASRACALRLKETRKRVQTLIKKQGGDMDLEFLDQDEGSFEEDDELADEDGLT